MRQECAHPAPALILLLNTEGYGIAESLTIIQLTATKDTPYRGERTDVVCCINVDPRGHVGAVHFLHNNTIRRAASETPYDRGLGALDKNAW